MSPDRRVITALWGGATLFVVAIGLTAAALVRTQASEAMAESEARVSRFVTTTESAINRSLLGTDLLLAGLAEPLAAAQRADQAGGQARRRVLAQTVKQSLWLRDVLLLDADGQVLAAGQDSTERLGTALPPGFAAALLAQATPQLQISAPVINPATAEPALYFARAVSLGEQRAVVVAEVPLSLVKNVLAPSIDMPGLNVTLERSDGTLLASVSSAGARPQLATPPTRIAAAAASAVLRAGQPTLGPARLDGTPALVLVQSTLYPGVQVAASLSLAEAQATGRRHKRTVLAVAGGFIVVLLGAAALGHGHVARMARARRELAASKTMLDQALASMSEGLLLLDAQDRVLLWNQRYTELFPWLVPVLQVGVSTDVLSRTAAQVVLPDATTAEREAWMAQRQALRGMVSGGTYAMTSAAGVVIDVAERRMPGGGTICTYRDGTATERKLALAKTAAEAANDAKSRFLATMSHEMRTPLNGVLGMIGLMLGSPLAPAQRRQAELIRSSGQTLLAVLNDILDLSKIEAGRMTLELAPFPLVDTVQDVVQLLSVRAAARGLGLVVHAPADLPPVLVGDASRLRQVLYNLVGNALKFTEQGQVDLTLSHQRLGPRQVVLTLVVADTGIGIDPEVLPRLFTRFSQADDSAARRHGGSGLGLAITREIVTLMGGEVAVQSVPGQGSRFTVVLPLAEGERPAPATSALAAAPRPRPPTPPLRILAADDNTVNQMLIKALLEEQGHHCDVVGDGSEAVAQVQAAHYDLVLMDIQMAEMDGLDATRAIRALPGGLGRLPILAMTANLMPEQQARYRVAGMAGVVTKPIDPAELDAAIAHAVAGARAALSRPSPR